MRLEKTPVRILDDHEQIAVEVAGRIAGIIRSRAEEGKTAHFAMDAYVVFEGD